MNRSAFPTIALLALTAAPVAARAADDPAKGKVTFQQCRVCHTVEAGGRSQVGPNLNGIVGRAIASVKGFAYSPAMTRQRGTWTRARLDAYLAAPARAVPGNRMAYPGLSDPVVRGNLIAYLAAAR